jgi:hypothetical protein
LPNSVLFVWICFLVRGVFYCAALPLWEGFDEYSHFARVQHVAAGRWLAAPGDTASREVERSIELAPMPWATRSDALRREIHESYWKLPAEERARRERETAALRGELARTVGVHAVPAEWQQPPLSYWLMAAAYKPMEGAGLRWRVLVLRLICLLLASAAVPAAWMAARRVIGDEHVALAVAAAVAVFPELMFDGARVSNSALSIGLFSLLAVLCLDVADGKRSAAVPLAVVLGLGLLTKAFFLTTVPVGVALLAWRRRWMAIGLAAAIPGWWYLMNWWATGSFSTAIQDAALRDLTLWDRLRRLPNVEWLTALDSTFFSHIWFGGWSFLQVRSWIYHVFAAVAVMAIAAAAVAWFRGPRRHLTVLGSLYVLFCAGVAYHVLITFLANGVSSSAGWYLCAVIVPEMVLAGAGLRRGMIAIVAAFALLDLYGMLFVALPYYTGFIGHGPRGFLEAFHPGQVDLAAMLRRIGFLDPRVVALLLCGYIAATVLSVVIIAGRRRP